MLHALAISLAETDVYTLSALDGGSFTSATAAPPTLPTTRTEPAANFYIIYGLSFEILVKSLGDSSTSPLAIIALKVMQSLVKPSIAGTSVFEGAFFDELCTVAYRIGMSEPAIVRKEMIDLICGYALGRRPANSNSISTFAASSSLDPAQTRRVLAIVTFTLRGLIPDPQAQSRSNFTYSDSPSDRITLLRTGLGAFTNLVECVEITQRADLYAVGIHLFGDILKDESAAGSGEVTAGCLGSLKGLIDGLVRSQVPGMSGSGSGDGHAGRVIGGLLGGCLGNVDDMR